MVDYGINYTLLQVGATSRSRPGNQEINGINSLWHSPGRDREVAPTRFRS